MYKTLLIAQSEYGRRVRSKVFVAVTLLAPVLLLAATLLPALVLALSTDSTRRHVAVVDETGAPGFAEALATALPEQYVAEPASAVPLDSLRARVLDGRLDGFFVLPPGLLDGTAAATYYAAGGGGLVGPETLRAALREAVRAWRIRDAGASPEVLALLDERAALALVTVSEAGDAADGALISSIVGYAMGLLVYVAVLIYGMLVMRGVIEEKANRIVEVIASSVRPFELLMGKVLGIGAVGLTQLAAWAVLLVALAVAAGPLLAAFVEAPAMPTTGLPGAEAMPAELPFDPSALTSLFTPGLLLAFVGFFLGGYLLYAALFAAVGSAVEQESDAQALQLPVTLPVIVPVLFLPYVLERPDTTLSLVLSLVPFASPVLMLVRMTVSDVPAWQVALSFALLVAAFVGAVWMAGRIYRVGILMVGKKVTFRDLGRWLVRG